MLDTFKRIWAFSDRRHGALIRSLTASFLRSVFGITQLLAIILTVRVLTGEADAVRSIGQIAVLTIVCILGNFATSYVEQTGTLETGFFMVGDKRVGVGSLLRRVPLGFFNNSSVGRITATLTTTLSGVETASTMVMVGIISGLFNALALFLFMLYYNWRIGLITGAGMVCYLLVVNWQMRLSRKQAPALQSAQTRLAETALSYLQGIKVTKAFSFRRGDARLRDAIGGSCDANIRLTSRSMPSQFAAHLTIALFESLILLAALSLYFVSHAIPLVQTVVLMIFSFMVYASLNQAGSMLSMIGLLDTGLEEVAEIERTGQLETAEPRQTAASNEVEFHNVSFSYGDHEVLHDISAVLKPRSFTAVIGPSGSGKTTLCQLIPRFRDVDSGSITIGGADIRHMDEKELMQKISMVFQNVYLFEDTVLNNIRFGRPDATFEEVVAAAEAARCDRFIRALPQGYDTMVEEGGSNLSGGEKQRISIARAILKDSPIIILDEPTSALDAENEHEILAAIDALTRDKTVIMIAHRLQTVRGADQILVLDHAQIVQRGTHEQLLREDGLYADFVRARQKTAGWTIV